MKKHITKEQIIETALELTRNKSSLDGLTLREIARALNCAHTNLYNYFPSYNDLLWEAHAVLHEIFTETLDKKLDTANTAALRLSYFFAAFVEWYMDNKGWFRLAWHENIEGKRPVRDIEATNAATRMLNRRITAIWKELSGAYPDMAAVERILHNTHCYIVGEISNYLSGRAWIENEAEFKAYMIQEATHTFTVCLLECDRNGV